MAEHARLYTSRPTGATPESIAKAWDSALQGKPDAVIQGANPRILFEKYLKRLEADRIPYVADAVARRGDRHRQRCVRLRGAWKWIARWVVADTDGKANAAEVLLQVRLRVAEPRRRYAAQSPLTRTAQRRSPSGSVCRPV